MALKSDKRLSSYSTNIYATSRAIPTATLGQPVQAVLRARESHAESLQVCRNLERGRIKTCASQLSAQKSVRAGVRLVYPLGNSHHHLCDLAAATVR